MANLEAMPRADVSHVAWWLILLQGISAVIISLLLIFDPGLTTIALVQLMGAYWLVGGIFSIASIFMDRRLWGWKMFKGLLGIVAGLLVIQNPLLSALIVPMTLVIVLALQGIIIGAVDLVKAFQGGGWGIGILGVLSIALGGTLLVFPLIAALTFLFVLGSMAIVGGIGAILLALRARGLDRGHHLAPLQQPVMIPVTGEKKRDSDTKNF